MVGAIVFQYADTNKQASRQAKQQAGRQADSQIGSQASRLAGKMANKIQGQTNRQINSQVYTVKFCFLTLESEKSLVIVFFLILTRMLKLTVISNKKNK